MYLQVCYLFDYVVSFYYCNCFFVMFFPLAAVAHTFPCLWYNKGILILCLFLFCSV